MNYEGGHWPGSMPLAVCLYEIFMRALNVKGVTSGSLDWRCGSHVRWRSVVVEICVERCNNIDQTSLVSLTLTTVAVDENLTTR